METRCFICGPRYGRWSKPKPVVETKEYKEGKLPKKLRCDNDHILHSGQRKPTPFMGGMNCPCLLSIFKV